MNGILSSTTTAQVPHPVPSFDILRQQITIRATLLFPLSYGILNVICITGPVDALALLTFMPLEDESFIHRLVGVRIQCRPTVDEALLAMKEDLESSIVALTPEDQDRLGEALITHIDVLDSLERLGFWMGTA